MNHQKSTPWQWFRSCSKRSTKYLVAFVVLFSGLASVQGEPAQTKPKEVVKIRLQITGFFSPDREADFRKLCAEQTRVKLIDVKFKEAEAEFEFVPADTWPDYKPDNGIQLFNNYLNGISRGTFGAKPLCQIPKDKLKLIDINVEGLDCKGCSFAAYQMIFRLPGVEQATASFKSGKVTALVDPQKIDRSALETALKKGGVTIKTPGK